MSTIVSENASTVKPTAGDLIDPTTLMRIKSLELRARMVVEGFWSGLNRSPYHGFSVEFTEYREYSPGDDPRYLDWKLYARSDRYYIKRFEDETNLRCHLLLDMSRSMEYGSLSYSKLEYARTLVATLGYFLTSQRDAVGLVTFNERIEESIPARFRPGHFRRLLVALEQSVGGADTNLIRPLREIVERVAKRGLLILVSDLLAPVDELETHLGYLRARGHEVLLFHIMDPAELTFDFEQPALFEDPESKRELYIDPSKARRDYLRKLEAHLAGVRASCERLGVTYRQFATDMPLELALSEFLRSRLHEQAGAKGTLRVKRRSAV